MELTYFGKSDKGRVRKANEDFFADAQIDGSEHLFIVADGMGGHQAGEVASRLGTQTFINEYKSLRGQHTHVKDAMDVSIKKANATILKKAMSDPGKRGMGTTFSAIVISDMKATITHVGDSRIYLIRNNRIKKITKDHTFVEKMVEEGRISEEEARDHPQKNILYMSLGARESFIPEVIENVEIREGDILFMCTDGLNGMVTDNYIKEYASEYYPQDAVEKLISMANDNGGNDNITIQIIRVGKVKNVNKTEPLSILNIKKKKNLYYAFLAVCCLLLLVLIWIFLG